MHHSCKGVQASVVGLKRPPQFPSKRVITTNVLRHTAGIVGLEWQQEASPRAFPIVIEVVRQSWAAEDCLQLHVGNPACQLSQHDHSNDGIVTHCTHVQGNCSVLLVPSVTPLVDNPYAENEGHDAHEH